MRCEEELSALTIDGQSSGVTESELSSRKIRTARAVPGLSKSLQSSLERRREVPIDGMAVRDKGVVDIVAGRYGGEADTFE